MESGIELTSNAQDDLSANDTCKVGSGRSSTVSQQQSKGENKETSSRDDEPLEASDSTDYETETDADDDRDKAVNVGDPSGRLDGSTRTMAFSANVSLVRQKRHTGRKRRRGCCRGNPPGCTKQC